MAQQPHDCTGTRCACGREFTKSSYVGSIIKREEVDGKVFIRQRRVCRECHNKHFEAGE